MSFDKRDLTRPCEFTLEGYTFAKKPNTFLGIESVKNIFWFQALILMNTSFVHQKNSITITVL
jgi:hypothetical protein